MATTAVGASGDAAGTPSVSDLLGMIPSGAMEAASTIEEPAKEGIEPETPVDDGQIETPEVEATEPEQEATAEEPAKEPEQDKAPAKDAKTEEPKAEDIPEGVVKGKNRKGEEGYFATPERWEKIYGAYKTAQEASRLLGEPMTVEALKDRVAQADAYGYMMSDLASGDKTSQQRVLNHMLERMEMAHKAGETGSDPSVTFVDTLYSRLAGSGTAAEHTMRLRNTQDLMRELAAGAASTNDQKLAVSLQHVVRHLAGIGPDETNIGVIKAAAERMGLPFHSLADLPAIKQGTTPEAQLRAENAALRAQLNGKAAPAAQQESLSDWWGNTKKAVDDGISESVILPALAAHKEAWSKLADGEKQFELRILNPLKADIAKKLSADQTLQDRLADLKDQAKRATSADVRKRIADRIHLLTTNQARLLIDELKVPHVKFAVETVKGLSDSAHQRRAGAQQKAVPRGTSAPVNRGLVPQDTVSYQNGVFDPATAVADMNQRMRRLVG